MRSEAHSRPVFPLGLMIAGKPCLVVGGGRVALRKTQLLLEAGAQVLVVSPEAVAELQALIAAGRVRHAPRAFAAGDVAGCALAFAATNHTGVNEAVLAACRAARIPCCLADGNWVRGDFVTPATLRRGELTVAISTGGRSCRKSRLLKESLARHLDLAERVDLLVLGTSHHHLSVDAREPFHLGGAELERVGRMLLQVWGVHEFVLLNTCNRIELLGVVSREAAVEELLQRLMGFERLDADSFYLKRGAEAFDHVAILAAGLLSQTPGENNIVAQLKEALELAGRQGWAAGRMQEWLAAALHVAKHIRQHSDPLLRRLEVEDLAVAFVKARCAALAAPQALVVGTGVVGRALVTGLLAAHPRLSLAWCYHRRVPELPEAWRGRVRLYAFAELPAALAGADAVLTATASPEPVLRREHAAALAPARPVVLVDLAMPRNIDPELARLAPQAELVDLDGLKRWYEQEVAPLDRILEHGRAALREHVESYERIVRNFQGRDAGE